MAKVHTVLGEVDVSQLGITLMHEHIVGMDAVMAHSFPTWFDREHFVRHACGVIERAKRCGVRTIVDQSTIDMGRRIDVIREVSEKAQVHIIVATGFYAAGLPWLKLKSAEFIADLLVQEYERGIAGTGVRPGMIKCASYAGGVDEQNRKLLTATALAHKATGLPIGTHSEAHTGRAQQEIFAQCGVDLRRVIIGHLGDLSDRDVDYMQAVAERGSFVGMDRFGIDSIQPLKARASSVAQLCKRGFADRIILGHDHIIWADFEDAVGLHGCAWQDVDWKALEEHPVQFTYLFKKVLPLLRELGVSDEQIHTMLVETPQAFFGGEPVAQGV